jgi:hypothetical protein
MRPTPPQAISSSATAAQGLRVKAALDENIYDAGPKAGNTERAAAAIERDELLDEWHVRIRPQHFRRNAQVFRPLLLAS